MNQSLSLIDAVLRNGFDDSIATPPNESAEGASYRVTSPATDSWEGHEGEIAIQLGGAWHFLIPHEGMTMFDRQAGAFIHYNSEWQSAIEPTNPTGGANIDAEARQMLSELVEALRMLGIFANPA